VSETRKTLWKAQDIVAHKKAYSQRLNENSYLNCVWLSRLAGMKRATVSLARIPPGKDSFAYHAHLLEEEWIYILSGRGVVHIGGEDYEVGPGDFMGFAAPQVAHLLGNPFDTELVYLMGGESVPLDVIDYPGLGKRYLLMSGERGSQFYELSEPTKPFGRAPG
jgi:uncharacterized cupin superfamily protein